MLPDHLAARFSLGSWEVPGPFRQLVEWGDIPDDESFRVWNMGLGLVVVVGAEQRDEVFGQGLTVVGELEAVGSDEGRVRLDGEWW